MVDLTKWKYINVNRRRTLGSSVNEYVEAIYGLMKSSFTKLQLVATRIRIDAHRYIIQKNIFVDLYEWKSLAMYLLRIANSNPCHTTQRHYT